SAAGATTRRAGAVARARRPVPLSGLSYSVRGLAALSDDNRWRYTKTIGLSAVLFTGVAHASPRSVDWLGQGGARTPLAARDQQQPLSDPAVGDRAASGQSCAGPGHAPDRR